MNWTTIAEWVSDLGRQYGVDPFIFGLIYIGAIPFFSLSVAWIIRNARRKQSIRIPLTFAALFFVSSYLYLLVAGRGIPLWVYVILALVAISGAYSTWKKIRSRLASSASACGTCHNVRS